MTDTRTLPHDDYVAAVTDALDAASIPVAESWTDDSETRGAVCHLTGVIVLDPSGTADMAHDDIPPGTSWPHGLVLIWEWHTGREDGWDAGPSWEFAKGRDDGSTDHPTTLPMASGYASPDALIEATRKVLAWQIKAAFQGGWPDGWGSAYIDGTWERAGELEAACEAWGANEGAED